MALDDSALLELAEAMRTADGGDLMRRLLETILQALVDAEASAFIGAGPARAHPDPHQPAQRHPRQAAGHHQR